MPGPIIDIKDCTFFLIDGADNFIGIRIGEGTLNYTNRRNIEPRKARGNLWQIREGEQELCEVGFQFVWDEIISIADEPPTVEDVIYHENNAASWVSVSADPEAPFCINLQVVRSKTCRSPSGIDLTNQLVVTFYEFHATELAHSLRDGVIDCKGISNRTRPGIIRVTDV